MVLVFDTETNGVPKNYKGSVQDLENWPRVVQLAWAVFTSDGKPVRGFQSLILPDGWDIPEETTAVHGITMEKAMAQGKPAAEMLRKFIYDYECASVLVAHNIGFDYPVLAAEMIRYGVKASKKVERKICTMDSSTEFCRLPGKFGKKYKWPKLEELHTILFGQTFEGAHDAMVDVNACARCYFELVSRGVIS